MLPLTEPGKYHDCDFLLRFLLMALPQETWLWLLRIRSRSLKSSHLWGERTEPTFQVASFLPLFVWAPLYMSLKDKRERDWGPTLLLSLDNYRHSLTWII
jgi:hypothetical protein